MLWCFTLVVFSPKHVTNISLRISILLSSSTMLSGFWCTYRLFEEMALYRTKNGYITCFIYGTTKRFYIELFSYHHRLTSSSVGNAWGGFALCGCKIPACAVSPSTTPCKAFQVPGHRACQKANLEHKLVNVSVTYPVQVCLCHSTAFSCNVRCEGTGIGHTNMP